MKLPTKLLLLPLFLLSLSCSDGGDGGGGGPTAPPPPTGYQALFTLVLAPNVTQGGVQEATLSLDGREIARSDWSNIRGGCLANCQLQANVAEVAAGNHTVTITILRQTRASLRYSTFGVVLATHRGTGEQRGAEFQIREQTLRAGETVSYSFSL